MYGTLEDSVEHVITLHRRQWLSGEQSDILVILIIIALPLVIGQHELCLLRHLSFLRRLHINILDDKGLLLLLRTHPLSLLLHPHLVHERVGRVQRAQVL